MKKFQSNWESLMQCHVPCHLGEICGLINNRKSPTILIKALWTFIHEYRKLTRYACCCFFFLTLHLMCSFFDDLNICHRNRSTLFCLHNRFESFNFHFFFSSMLQNASLLGAFMYVGNVVKQMNVI